MPVLKHTHEISFHISAAMKRCAQAYVASLVQPSVPAVFPLRYQKELYAKEAHAVSHQLLEALRVAIAEANPEWEAANCLLVSRGAEGAIQHVKVTSHQTITKQLNDHFFGPWLAPLCRENGLPCVPNLSREARHWSQHLSVSQFPEGTEIAPSISLQRIVSGPAAAHLLRQLPSTGFQI